jgi:hypothetical protein
VDQAAARRGFAGSIARARAAAYLHCRMGLFQVDLRLMAGGCGQAPVARQQRDIERLGQRDIRGRSAKSVRAIRPRAAHGNATPSQLVGRGPPDLPDGRACSPVTADATIGGDFRHP